MDRWTLLRHETIKSKIKDTHYDFLVENGNHCLTWKLEILPELDGMSVEINEHSNHRLIWLSRESFTLTNNRGYVERIDNGTFKLLDNNLNKDNFSLFLRGNIIRGIFKKKGNLCKLISSY